jgi:hypothetical protein
MNCKWCNVLVGDFPDEMMLHVRDCPSAPEGVRNHAQKMIGAADMPQVDGAHALERQVAEYKEKNGAARRTD